MYTLAKIVNWSITQCLSRNDASYMPHILQISLAPYLQYVIAEGGFHNFISDYNFVSQSCEVFDQFSGFCAIFVSSCCFL